MIIIKNLIEKYIDKLTIEDIKKYVSNNFNVINDYEIIIIYDYIKKRWQEIYDNDPKVWTDLKKELSERTYNEALKLYKKFEYLK